MKTDGITGFDRVTGGFLSGETNDAKNPRLGLKLEAGFIKSVDGKAEWAGTPDTTIQMMAYQFNVNLMIYLYRGTLSPWIAPGVSIGSLELEHSNGSETKFHQGWNAQGGLDIMLGFVGLRAGYLYQNVYSDKFGKLGQRRMVFDFDRVFGALVFETN